jgi:hypothetical protein
MGDVLNGLFGRLGLNLTGLADQILVIGLTVFALVLGFFSLRFLSRRRQMLDHERMAALIKGLHYAGVSRDVFTQRGHEAQDHLLRGLRWLFGAGGISGAFYGYAALQPANVVTDWVRGALLGIIPGAIGLAHLLFSLICSLRSKVASRTELRGGSYYRTAGRRS